MLKKFIAHSLVFSLVFNNLAFATQQILELDFKGSQHHQRLHTILPLSNVRDIGHVEIDTYHKKVTVYKTDENRNHVILQKTDVEGLRWDLETEILKSFLNQHTASLTPLENGGYKLIFKGRLLGGGKDDCKEECIHFEGYCFPMSVLEPFFPYVSQGITKLVRGATFLNRFITAESRQPFLRAMRTDGGRELVKLKEYAGLGLPQNKELAKKIFSHLAAELWEMGIRKFIKDQIHQALQHPIALNQNGHLAVHYPETDLLYPIFEEDRGLDNPYMKMNDLLEAFILPLRTPVDEYAQMTFDPSLREQVVKDLDPLGALMRRHGSQLLKRFLNETPFARQEFETNVKQSFAKHVALVGGTVDKKIVYDQQIVSQKLAPAFIRAYTNALKKRPLHFKDRYEGSRIDDNVNGDVALIRHANDLAYPLFVDERAKNQSFLPKGLGVDTSSVMLNLLLRIIHRWGQDFKTDRLLPQWKCEGAISENGEGLRLKGSKYNLERVIDISGYHINRAILQTQFKTNVPGVFRVQIDDGFSSKISQAHPGNGEDHLLKVDFPVDKNATHLTLRAIQANTYEFQVKEAKAKLREHAKTFAKKERCGQEGKEVEAVFSQLADHLYNALLQFMEQGNVWDWDMFTAFAREQTKGFIQQSGVSGKLQSFMRDIMIDPARMVNMAKIYYDQTRPSHLMNEDMATQKASAELSKYAKTYAKKGCCGQEGQEVENAFSQLGTHVYNALIKFYQQGNVWNAQTFTSFAREQTKAFIQQSGLSPKLQGYMRDILIDPQRMVGVAKAEYDKAQAKGLSDASVDILASSFALVDRASMETFTTDNHIHTARLGDMLMLYGSNFNFYGELPLSTFLGHSVEVHAGMRSHIANLYGLQLYDGEVSNTSDLRHSGSGEFETLSATYEKREGAQKLELRTVQANEERFDPLYRSVAPTIGVHIDRNFQIHHQLTQNFHSNLSLNGWSSTLIGQDIQQASAKLSDYARNWATKDRCGQDSQEVKQAFGQLGTHVYNALLKFIEQGNVWDWQIFTAFVQEETQGFIQQSGLSTSLQSYVRDILLQPERMIGAAKTFYDKTKPGYVSVEEERIQNVNAKIRDYARNFAKKERCGASGKEVETVFEQLGTHTYNAFMQFTRQGNVWDINRFNTFAHEQTKIFIEQSGLNDKLQSFMRDIILQPERLISVVKTFGDQTSPGYAIEEGLHAQKASGKLSDYAKGWAKKNLCGEEGEAVEQVFSQLGTHVYNAMIQFHHQGNVWNGETFADYAREQTKTFIEQSGLSTKLQGYMRDILLHPARMVGNAKYLYDQTQVNYQGIPIRGSSYTIERVLDISSIKATSITLESIFRTNVPGIFGVQIWDGYKGSTSLPHPGDGTFKTIRVTHAIDPKSTHLSLRAVRANTSLDSDASVDLKSTRYVLTERQDLSQWNKQGLSGANRGGGVAIAGHNYNFERAFNRNQLFGNEIAITGSLKTNVPQTYGVQLWDGKNSALSPKHSGSGTAEELTCSSPLHPHASTLTVRAVQANNVTDGNIYDPYYRDLGKAIVSMVTHPKVLDEILAKTIEGEADLNYLRRLLINQGIQVISNDPAFLTTVGYAARHMVENALLGNFKFGEFLKTMVAEWSKPQILSTPIRDAVVKTLETPVEEAKPKALIFPEEKGKATILITYPEEDTGMKILTWEVPEEVLKKIPKEFGEARANRKKIGIRWVSKYGESSIRIDQGNPISELPSQKVDHVRINSEGKVLDCNGNPINSTLEQPKPAKTEEAHIPLEVWKKWREWNKP